jgi:hypothetical protein
VCSSEIVALPADMLVTVAFANKTGRIIWAQMVKGDLY